jgi:hypothetical protein
LDVAREGTRMWCNNAIRLGLIGSLVLAASSVQASPITYAFSGTLREPYNGSTRFSGTLVYNTELPLYPCIDPFPGWSYYSGVPDDASAPVSSLTFQLGDTPSSSFGKVSNLEMIVNHNPTSDAFFLYERFSGPGGQNLSAELGLGNDNLIQRGPFTSLDPPSQLSLSDFSNGGNLTLFGQTADGHDVNVVGDITSLTPTGEVPEPSTALIFAVLGTAIAGVRRSKAIRSGRGSR